MSSAFWQAAHVYIAVIEMNFKTSVFLVLFLCTPSFCALTCFEDVKTDKCRYEPGEQVSFTIDMRNNTNYVLTGHVNLIISHLAYVVKTVTISEVSLPVSSNIQSFQSAWIPPERDFTGYLIEAEFISGGTVFEKMNTAVDVSSDWNIFPRYGYISSFGPKNSGDIKDTIEWLNGYHINGLQFYDWQNYKHHIPLAGSVDNPDSTWVDVANRETKFITVMGYINSAHDRDMMCMNYNLLYGASANGYSDGLKTNWALFADNLHVTQERHHLPGGWATSYIMVFNPLHPDWRNYIFYEEEKVFTVFPFDGWHVDQLGKTGYSYEGDWIDMPSTYASFIQEGKSKLNTRFTFNAINEWGNEQIANKVDFMYVETWPESGDTYRRYLGFKWMFEHCRDWSGNMKNIVFAAYMNREASGDFNKCSVLLADAVIFATGGAHIELGEHGLLSKEYFPTTKPASSELMEQLRDYYHVATAYENMLRDRDIIEIARDVEISGITVSDWDEPGTVWEIAKQKRNDEILHLFNLTSLITNSWRDDYGTYPEAPVYSNKLLTYYTDTRIDKVLLVSPDYEHGSPQELTFTTNNIGGENCIQCTLPYLQYWDMVIFRTLPKKYYISQRATHTFDGSSIETAFTNIYQADQTIQYGNGDTIYIDGGTNGNAESYVYDSGGDENSVSRFLNLRDATAANDITIEGINGRPVIKSKYPSIQLHGVRYNFTIRNLNFQVNDGAAIVIANQNDYEFDPDVGAEAKWYPVSGGNITIENCVISNTSPSSAIVFGVNGDFNNREDSSIHTIVYGTRIISNTIYITSASNNIPGAIRFNVYGAASGVEIVYNNIIGPGSSSAFETTALKTEWNSGKDTDFIIAYNKICNWSKNAMSMDLGDSEIRENLIWNVGDTAIQVDGGVSGGNPNRFINNTIYNVGVNCLFTQYDGAATNLWINNLFVKNRNTDGYVIWSSVGDHSKDIFSACMSFAVSNILGGDNAFEQGVNYWNEDPVFVSEQPTNEYFLTLSYELSTHHALYDGLDIYGGKKWIGVGGGILGGPPIGIPEPGTFIILLIGFLRLCKKNQ